MKNPFGPMYLFVCRKHDNLQAPFFSVLLLLLLNVECQNTLNTQIHVLIAAKSCSYCITAVHGGARKAIVESLELKMIKYSRQYSNCDIFPSPHQNSPMNHVSRKKFSFEIALKSMRSLHPFNFQSNSIDSF